MPSEDDCQRYFAQNPSRFRSPDRIRVRHILLAAPADDIAGPAESAPGREADHRTAGTAAPVCRSGPRRSQCPSSSEGGDLGWLQRGQTTPNSIARYSACDKGLAGFPVESRWGYHVVSIDALEAGTALSFEQVQPQIGDYLELQVRQRDVQQFLLELRERYPVRGLEDIKHRLSKTQSRGRQ